MSKKSEPKMYPIASSVPLDRCYLRPLHNPLRDSEIYVPDKECCNLGFFMRPIDKPMLMCPDHIKTLSDTNMNQCSKRGHGLLDYPTEFSIAGFNLLLGESTSPDDAAAILDGGIFEFNFVGRRPYSDIPLSLMPGRKSQPSLADCMMQIIHWAEAGHDWYVCAGKDWMHEMSQCGYNKPPKDYDYKNIIIHEAILSMPVSKLMELAAKEIKAGTFGSFYPFNVGKANLKINPGEEFCVFVKWSSPPKTSKPVMLTALIEGYAWCPL